MSAAVQIIEAEADVRAAMRAIGREARVAARKLAIAPAEMKNRALIAAARVLRERSAEILAANARDLADAKAKGLSAALIDRLALNPDRIEGMARGLEEVGALPDPVGRVLATFTRPNGLVIERVATPLGVVGVIYESRPNVTADAGALCLKSGNAVVLRGGSDSFHSSAAIHACLVDGLEEAGLPDAAISRAPFASREAVGEMLDGLGGALDVIVPRGGRSLVDRVQREARVPVFAHLEGVVHVYVDRAADLDKALKIAVNAKMRRTGICGAAETLLVHRAAAPSMLKPLIGALIAAGCAVRGDAAAREADPRVTPASEEDWRTEYLDAIIAVRVVDSLEAAIEHIETYGSHHTDCIVTEDKAAAERFLKEVDSAIVMHNASTQFADGGEFGFGAEIGIATGRMHARGPVGLEQLCTFKYRVRGDGQTRACGAKSRDSVFTAVSAGSTLRFRDVAIDLDFALAAVGLGDVMAVLHPHERFHRNAECLFDPDRHIRREGRALVQKGREGRPRYAENPRSVRHRQPHGLDDLGLYKPAGMGGIFHPQGCVRHALLIPMTVPCNSGQKASPPRSLFENYAKNGYRTLCAKCVRDIRRRHGRRDMSKAVPAAEFARNFGRYKMLAQREAVPVSSNRTLAGYFVAPHEYEELQKMKSMRRRFRTAELSDGEAERIASSRMDSRHDHLNELLDPK
jgi:glutamate-5-semialdehyde dehydrogenase